MGQQIEHLRLDLAQSSVPAQLEAIGVQFKFAKGENHAHSPACTPAMDIRTTEKNAVVAPPEIWRRVTRITIATTTISCGQRSARRAPATPDITLRRPP